MRTFISKVLRITLIILTLFTYIPSISANTEQNRTVKVGFFNLHNFNTYDEYGNRSGYNYEYLMKIQEYTFWEYEFIDIPNWPSALEMLKNKEIDLLAPGQITEERKQHFLFSDYDSGMEYGSFLTRIDRSDLIYNDYENFTTQTFGCVDTSIFRDDYERIAEENNFTGKLVYYQNTLEMLDALDKGEIDIAVANLINQPLNNYKILAKFAPSLQYFMTYVGNEALMEELNLALRHIKTDNPNFQNDLTSKYFSSYYEIPLTKEELEYISEQDILNIALMSDADPISYVDENGNLQGITIKTLDLIAEKTGLKFNYHIIPSKQTIDLDYFYANDIDIIANVSHNKLSNSYRKFSLTYPYFEGRKVLVTNPGTTFSNNDEFSIAYPIGSFSLKQILLTKYPNATTIEYDTTAECLEALKSNKVDSVLQNRYVVERFLSKPRYSKLAITDLMLDDYQALALVLYNDNNDTPNLKTNNTPLLSILNKAILGLSNNEINSIIISETSGRPYDMDIGDYIDSLFYYLLLVLFIIVIITCQIIHIRRTREKHLAILAESEGKLTTITNNINIGVISLKHGQGISILDANEGLKNLLCITEQDYNNYTAIKLDRKSINNINAVIEQEETLLNTKITLQLHIYINETYIDTLFIGTLTKKDDNYLLYVVVIDVSEQQRLINELEAQQSRYTLLLNKADIMMFEYSLVTNKLKIDERFYENFLWKQKDFPTFEEFRTNFMMYEDDKPILAKTFGNLYSTKEDVHCRIRLLAKNNEPVWCDISAYILSTNGMPTTVLGTIEDVSAEVNEHANLRRQMRSDSLTGLWNKQAFYEEAADFLSNNAFTPNAVVFIDLDNFKAVNDTLGHIAGDQAIKDTSDKLQKIFANIDIISRFGGDEYCVFVKDIPKKTLINKLNWILEKLSTIYSDGEREVAITASIGVAYSPNDGQDILTLVENADKALYYSKEQGKNRFTFYDPSMEHITYEGRSK